MRTNFSHTPHPSSTERRPCVQYWWPTQKPGSAVDIPRTSRQKGDLVQAIPMATVRPRQQRVPAGGNVRGPASSWRLAVGVPKPGPGRVDATESSPLRPLKRVQRCSCCAGWPQRRASSGSCSICWCYWQRVQVGAPSNRRLGLPRCPDGCKAAPARLRQAARFAAVAR